MFAISFCIFNLLSNVTPRIFTDSLMLIVFVPTVKDELIYFSGFQLNITNSVLSSLIFRELFPVHLQISDIHLSRRDIASRIDSALLSQEI